MEPFPIAGASERVVYCSLYYAFLMLKGVHSYGSSGYFQYLKVFDTMCKKIVPSGCTLIDMSRNGKLYLSSVVSNLSWKIWIEFINHI